MALPVSDRYDGPFDPSFELHRLSRATLALVGRELMLAAHIQDRAAIPAILEHHPMEDAFAIAIDEWMTASPVYTRRAQRLLGFAGDDVPTIFKGIQLDVGMPHQFLDCGYRVADPQHGEFWLRSCGALADVRPMGVEMVRGMCHDIEDPTFDATAVATNPRAQVRPIHRPPEVPHGGPDCHWTVVIDPAHPPVEAHPNLGRVASSLLAALPNDPPPSAEPGGWEDYAGPFDPHFELEDLSQRALVLACREFAVQGHLLARAVMLAVADRDGVDAAVALGRALFTGIGWIAAERLVPVLGVGDDPPAVAIAKVLQVTHVLALRDYLGLSVSTPDEGTVLVTVAGDAPALGEGDAYSVAGLLDLGAAEILASLAHGVDARAVVEAVDAPLEPGVRAAWRITVPEDGEPAPQPDSVQMVRFTNAPAKVFVRRRPVRR